MTEHGKAAQTSRIAEDSGASVNRTLSGAYHPCACEFRHDGRVKACVWCEEIENEESRMTEPTFPPELVETLYMRCRDLVHAIKEGETIDPKELEDAEDALQAIDDIGGYEAQFDAAMAQIDRAFSTAP